MSKNPTQEPSMQTSSNESPAEFEVPKAACVILHLDGPQFVKNCHSIIIEDECPSLAVQAPHFQLAVMNQTCQQLHSLNVKSQGACIIMNGDEFTCESLQKAYQCAKSLADSKGLYGYFLLGQACEEPTTHTL